VTKTQESATKKTDSPFNVPVVYSTTEAALAELREQYAALMDDDFVIADSKDLTKVREAIADLRTRRTGLDRERLDLTKGARDFTERVNAEAKKIVTELVAIEKPLKEKKAAYDAAKKAEKEAKARAERERVEAVQAKIRRFDEMVVEAAAADTEEIGHLMAEMGAVEIDEAGYMEFTEQAGKARDEAMDKIEAILNRRYEDEENARKQAEREKELEAERKALEEQRAKERAEAEAAAAELRRQQEELEAEKRRQAEEALAERKRIESEKAEIESEKARIADEKAAKERKEKEAKEAEERVKAEQARLAALKPDAEKFKDWVTMSLEPAIESISGLRVNTEEGHDLRGNVRSTLLETVDMIQDLTGRF